MPELPEVETVVRQLAPAVTGRRLRAIDLLDPRLGQLDVESLCGRQVQSVSRLGKQIVVELRPMSPRGSGRTAISTGRWGRVAVRASEVATVDSSGPLWLAVHLRMTGRLLWQQDAVRGVEGDGLSRTHQRARLWLDGGCVLFVDPRRFGTMVLVDDLRRLQPAGLDPLSDGFTPRTLAGLLGRSSQSIKAWLLRQDRLVGLGNIYASEILHEARIDPRRPAGELSSGEVKRLCRATVSVLERAVAACGTTFSDFEDAHGVTGSYQRYLAVYQREGEPCRCCGETVQRLVQQQRSTFFCARCQH